MELIGTNTSSYNLCFQQDASYSNNIFTSYNNWVGQVNGTVAPNTLKFTYYSPASGCPWYSSGTSANCWMVQVMGINNIPLSNKSVHLIYTNSSTSQSGFLAMPTSISNGQMCHIKDATGGANSNNIILQETNTNPLDGSSSYTLNGSYSKATFVYAGSGSNGAWLSL
jgi:hypothetical protein